MKVFKGPGGFGRIVSIIMNAVMCAVFSFFALWTVQNAPGNETLPILTPLSYAVSFVQGFCVGYFVADVVPVFFIGSAAARRVGAKGKVTSYLVTVLVIDLVVTTVISFCMSWFNLTARVGFEAMLMSWLAQLPLFLVMGYAVQLIIMKPAMSFAVKASGFDPAKVPAGGPGTPGGPMGPGGPAGGPGAGTPPQGAAHGMQPQGMPQQEALQDKPRQDRGVAG